jgi:hypothetical protein
MEGGTEAAKIRDVVAALLHANRTNCEIAGEVDFKGDDEVFNENDAAARLLSCSSEPQQSSRMDFKRDDDSLMAAEAVEEHDSDRKWDEKCSQN